MLSKNNREVTSTILPTTSGAEHFKCLGRSDGDGQRKFLAKNFCAFKMFGERAFNQHPHQNHQIVAYR